jgi:hypothetical protein
MSCERRTGIVVKTPYVANPNPNPTLIHESQESRGGGRHSDAHMHQAPNLSIDKPLSTRHILVGIITNIELI